MPPIRLDWFGSTNPGLREAEDCDVKVRSPRECWCDEPLQHFSFRSAVADWHECQ